ncbi:MAG: tRNA adenosine(34) deaminase TadA [Granulosicoccaceae bacterium]
MLAEDTKFMQAALQQAEKAADEGEVPIGAIVVHQGAIVGEGHNQSRALNDPTAHAEVLALRNAAAKLGSYRLTDVSLYVTVEPCLMCSGALLEARIGRLVFGAREPKTGAVISTAETLMSSRCQHRVAVTEGVLQADCAQLMQSFFKSKR